MSVPTAIKHIYQINWRPLSCRPTALKARRLRPASPIRQVGAHRPSCA